MLKLTFSKKTLQSLLTIIVLLIYCGSTVSALTQEQKDSLLSGARYFNTELDGAITCSPTSSTTSTTGNSVYFIGDSLTVGMKGAGLEQKAQSKGLKVTQIEGTVGISVPASIAKLQADQASVVAADTVVVELGTNDGGSTGNALNQAGFTTRINDMIDAIRAINSKAQIYWMNAYKDGFPTAYGGINSAISSQAGSKGYKAIDWHNEATLNNSKYAPFDADLHVHPYSHYSELADFLVGGLFTGGAAQAGGDASCACSTSTTSLDGSDNEAKVWNYLIGKGLTPEQVAGIMGNMAAEAHFEPRLVEYGWPNSRGETSVQGQPSSLDENVPPNVGPQGQPGYGIVQWTSPTRKQGLKDRATVAAIKAGDLGLQLDYLWSELTGGYSSVLNDIKASTTYQQATYIFLSRFEVPGDIPGQTPIREKNANDILTQYGSGTSSGGATTSPVSCGSGVGSGGPVTPPSGSGQQLALDLLKKHYKGTINGHTYNGDGQLTCQTLNCQDLDNTAYGVSIQNNGGQCSVSAIGKDLIQYLTVVIEQGRFAIGISALCNDHSVGSSTGASQSRHNVGEGLDINYVNKVWLCSTSSEGPVISLLKYTNAMIGTSLAPDQLLNQGVGAGSGCSQSDNYIKANDDLSMDNHASAPGFTSKYVGDHENHVHVGY